MGKVILVPPPTNKQYLKANPAFGNSNSSSFMNFPVMFGPNYGNSGLNATVSIPVPIIEVDHYDPMQAYGRFYNFTSKREYGCGYMIHRVYDINKAFWGHGEIEEIAASMRGDLLVQIDEEQVVGNLSWNFMACDCRDYKIVAEFPSKKKNHRFEVSKFLRKEIEVWINQNIKDDYDFYETPALTSSMIYDEYFIKDDIEAIHFKMKWFGAEPEDFG